MKGSALVLTALLLCAGGCSGTSDDGRPERADVRSAVCTLNATEGNTARGTVYFTTVEGGIKVTARVEGLTPGMHAFHVHEVGDCSAPDASSAGGHFNPMDMPHAGPDAEKRHLGDLGNLVAGEDGVAEYEHVDAHLRLSGEYTIVGRAVVVHAGADDLATQPTGGAGDRVACGVIEGAFE